MTCDSSISALRVSPLAACHEPSLQPSHLLLAERTSQNYAEVELSSQPKLFTDVLGIDGETLLTAGYNSQGWRSSCAVSLRLQKIDSSNQVEPSGF